MQYIDTAHRSNQYGKLQSSKLSQNLDLKQEGEIAVLHLFQEHIPFIVSTFVLLLLFYDSLNIEGISF